MAKKDEADVKAKKDSKDPVDKESKEAKKPEASGSGVSAFLQGTKEELDKVVWPTRQQLISESVAVILMVILSATFIYLIDNFFSWVAQQVF